MSVRLVRVTVKCEYSPSLSVEGSHCARLNGVTSLDLSGSDAEHPVELQGDMLIQKVANHGILSRLREVDISYVNYTDCIGSLA